MNTTLAVLQNAYAQIIQPLCMRRLRTYCSVVWLCLYFYYYFYYLWFDSLYIWPNAFSWCFFDVCIQISTKNIKKKKKKKPWQVPVLADSFWTSLRKTFPFDCILSRGNLNCSQVKQRTHRDLNTEDRVKKKKKRRNLMNLEMRKHTRKTQLKLT